MKTLKEKIINMIEINKRVNDFIDKAGDINFDIIETEFYHSYADLLEMYEDEICGGNKDKFDVLSWFVFEYLEDLEYEGKKPAKENAKMFDENEEPICYDIDSLCDYLMNDMMYDNEAQKNKWKFYNSSDFEKNNTFNNNNNINKYID